MKFLDTNGVRKIKEYIDGLINSIKSIIFDNEEVTAAALNDLNTRVNSIQESSSESQSSYNNDQKVVAAALNDLNDRVIDVEGTIKNISFEETDPVFTASAAHNISSSDITNWNNKVSNVQSDWNATSGAAVILHKPTIPTKVSDLTDDVVSGNYLPIGTSVWGDLIGINRSGTEFKVTLDGEFDPNLQLVGSNSSSRLETYQLSFTDNNNAYGTMYGTSSIFYKLNGGTTYYTLSFPEKSGTIAVESSVQTSIPQTGMLPNTLYNLGTLSGNTTFTLNTSAASTGVNHYYWTFETGSIVPTITWPSGLTWPEGSAPTLKPNHHYEISVLNNVVAWMEV